MGQGVRRLDLQGDSPSISTRPGPAPAHRVYGSPPNIAGVTAGAESSNWSGEVTTGATYTAVGGDWVVPAVQPSVSDVASATWVGIDGFSNTSLIQTGTSQQIIGGTTQYFAWYEILPAVSVAFASVSPGDAMEALITEQSLDVWNIAIEDVTANWEFSDDFDYSGPGTSAEWIEEAPTINNSQATLADFGSVEFSDAGFSSPDAGSAGVTPVSMSNGDGVVIAYPGAIDDSTNSFPVTYGTPAPVVDSLSPPQGSTSGGTAVMINGDYLTGASSVSFGGVSVPYAVSGPDNSLLVTAPAASAGVANITVTTPGGTSAVGVDDEFTYVEPPTVTAVSPTSGYATGGTSVTITGTNLTGATVVEFGPNAATYTVTSATSISATAPAGSGVVDITVTTPGGLSATSSADQFTYTLPPAPAVTALSPTSGPTTGGTSVTITGSNFIGASGVDFGASGATGVTVLSSTSINATSPASEVGTVDVEVVTPGGTSTPTGVDEFTYVQPPISPASPTSSAPSTPPTRSPSGYDLVGRDGGVFVFPTGQSGGYYGSLPGLGVHVNDIVGMVPSPDDKGYFLVGQDGGVFAFGDAPYLGSLPGLRISVHDIRGIVPTRDNRGYFLVGQDGGVFAFGDAAFLGSLPGEGIHLDDVTGIAATPSDLGYWVVAGNGTVYSFGNAPNFGSASGASSPVSGIASTPDGGGYWIVTQNGGVSTFGDAGYFFSLPALGVKPSRAIIGLVPTSDDGGYWLVGSDGGIFALGDAGFVGSLPGLGVRVTDIVGAVPTTL